MLPAARRVVNGNASLPYVLPFAVFLVFLALDQHLPPSWRPGYPVRIMVVSFCLVLLSRSVVTLRTTRSFASVALGLAVFVIWIGPDLLWPGYREHWLFRNPLTGEFQRPLSRPIRTGWFFLFFRVAGSAIVVPIIEELFWRGWLMRYLVKRDFQSAQLGACTAQAFWITAVLFASEHGPYWDVGLAAGVAYNAWIVRTRSLGDCILAHAVTNAALAVYVLWAGKWDYWI